MRIILKTYLVVNLNTAMIQDKTAKKIANLIIAEIESSNDYL
ncbi:10818_t:CDS:2 [Scutellospora calospora]|uniref:10818_t:CDS:1 n=1 Tax=Scutellospora calospora TaxID=85575 RepID=A0ACA9K473_9GLOM|nr:10818_t:CDS:2 [Scutellospora calospora]